MEFRFLMEVLEGGGYSSQRGPLLAPFDRSAEPLESGFILPQRGLHLGDRPGRGIFCPDDATQILGAGSMAGQKIEQARDTLNFCLKRLRPQDHFNVVRFSTDVETLFAKPAPATTAKVA